MLRINGGVNDDTAPPARKAPIAGPFSRPRERRRVPPWSRAFPAVLRAQAPIVKIGTLHCVTGPLAEPGQACRVGAQMAADAINAAGGIKSMGGARIELLLGDTQTKAEVARTEAERLINAGAQLLMGTFNSGDTAAVVPVAQQRRVPFLVDISAADPITANVAKSVRDGQQKVQYVYRNFPTGTLFGQQGGPVLHRDLQGGGRLAQARGRHVRQRPLRPEPGAGIPGRPQGRESVMGDRGGHLLARAAVGSLHRGVSGQGGQARRDRPHHPAGQRPASPPGDRQAASRHHGHRGSGEPRPLRSGADRRPQGETSST